MHGRCIMVMDQVGPLGAYRYMKLPFRLIRLMAHDSGASLAWRHSSFLGYGYGRADQTSLCYRRWQMVSSCYRLRDIWGT